MCNFTFAVISDNNAAIIVLSARQMLKKDPEMLKMNFFLHFFALKFCSNKINAYLCIRK